jgi:transcriptional regulator with XRE-family HTH domain
VITELEKARFHRLVDEMASERKRRYGWMASSARALGLQRSTLSKVIKGERPVTEYHLARAHEVLRIPLEYFSAEHDERHYREWLPAPTIEMLGTDAIVKVWGRRHRVTLRDARAVLKTIEASAGDPDAERGLMIRLLLILQSGLPIVAAYHAAAKTAFPGPGNTTGPGEIPYAAMRIVHALDEMSLLYDLRADSLDPTSVDKV